jgi:uncharacterized SAM-binding protein YcdF (DUF218 family)
MPEIFSFWLSKIVWGVLAPSHLFVILLLLTFIFSIKRPLRYFLRGLSMLCLVVIMLLPVGEWALLPLEQCYTDDAPTDKKIDGIIVLGGAVSPAVTKARRSIAFNGSADRVIAGFKLMRQYPDAQFVYAGGPGFMKYADFFEADYVKHFYKDLGLDVTKGFYENQSRNTYENAFYSKEIWGNVPAQNWLLVTSAYHMPRAYSLFDKMGRASRTNFIPYPVDYKTIGMFKFDMTFDFLNNLDRLDTAAKEYIGLIFNKLSRRSAEFWPCAPHKSEALQ